MAWNTSRRPKISNKLGMPNRFEGSDGDLQVRQSGLGAKLFGKVGGRWYDAPLAINGVSKFGANISDHLAINNEEITVFKNGKKVSSFGSDISLFGKIRIGGTTGGFDSADNIIIGDENSILGSQNIANGYQAGNALVANSQTNVLIGYRAGLLVADSSLGNVCVGSQAGDAITEGDYNTCIGNQSDASATASNQTALGYGAAPDSANDIAIGNTSVDEVKGQVDFSTFSDERIKTNIIDGDLGLDFIKLLKTRKYNKVNPAEYPSSIKKPKDGDGMIWTDAQANKVWDGLVSQEVKEAIDTCGTTYSGWNEESNSKQLLTYSTIVVPLIKAVQELSAKIDTMQEEINTLKQA